MSYPFPELNILRVQVNKGGSEAPVEVTVTTAVTTNPDSMFIFKRNPWSSKTFVNMPPCANAGPDQTLDTLFSTTLLGSVTDDGDNGSALITTWSQVNGPGTVMFGDADALETTASFSVSGTYVLSLTVNDGQFQKNDETTIAVNGTSNNAPFISSFAPASGEAGTEVTITGSNFSDITGLTFNGVPPGGTTSFTVNSTTEILTTVPTGAATGKIIITNSFGAGISVDDFVITGGSSGPLTFYLYRIVVHGEDGNIAFAQTRRMTFLK